MVRTCALALAAVLALGACVGAGNTGSNNQSQNTEAKVAQEPTEPTTITFASWVGDSPQMQKFAKDFHEEYPNITIKFANVPAERATDKLTTQVAGGNPPDVAFMDASAVEQFASREALVNLDGYIAGSDVIVEDDYIEGFKQAAVFEDSLYGLPFDGETTGLFYRTDLFEAAGIEEPPATWEEFEEAAAALTDKAKKQYGFIVFAPEAYYYWYPWLWQAGGDLLNEDQTEVAFDDEAGQEAADFYTGLAKYSPPDYYNSNSWDGRVAFASGKVAMYMAGSWFGGEMKVSFPEITDKWDVAPLPEGPAGCATTLAGDVLAIFAQSDKQDAAWLWIEYLSRDENMKTWTYGSETSTLLPPRQSLLDDPELGKHNPWLEGFADNMACARTNNITAEAWPEIEQILNENLGKAIYGEMSGAEAVVQAGERGDELLQQAR
ncbi:MAG TPA: sugar ABC transporter substrate-binding protein [Thermoanaerobaculia bacterium]|nr:sugar ABC transporter substrate-binding protein [Thermoanaerobaculia bacterium]